MIAIYFYCDESGKPPRDQYVSFGGYIGKVADWNATSRRWNDLLHRYHIPPIHVSRMNHPENDAEWQRVALRYGNSWSDVREEILDSFASIISESEVKPIAVHVDTAEFARKPKVSRDFEKPHYLAFVYCMRESISVIQWPPQGYSMGIVVDHDEETSRGCLDLVSELRKKEPQVAKYIGSLCFVDDKEFPGVQAADMLLNLTRRAIVSGAVTPSDRIKKLITPHYQPMVIGDAFLQRVEDQLQ